MRLRSENENLRKTNGNAMRSTTVDPPAMTDIVTAASAMGNSRYVCLSIVSTILCVTW